MVPQELSPKDFPGQPSTKVSILLSHICHFADIDCSERTPNVSQGLIDWIRDFFAISDSYVLNHHSLDAFLLLRLLKMGVITCLVGCMICMPVLFPVNATGGGGKKQLDIITMSNVTNNYYRFFAHAGCAYLFFGNLCMMSGLVSILANHIAQASYSI